MYNYITAHFSHTGVYSLHLITFSNQFKKLDNLNMGESLEVLLRSQLIDIADCPFHNYTSFPLKHIHF